jgi:hypothetical protein
MGAGVEGGRGSEPGAGGFGNGGCGAGPGGGWPGKGDGDGRGGSGGCSGGNGLGISGPLTFTFWQLECASHRECIEYAGRDEIRFLIFLSFRRAPECQRGSNRPVSEVIFHVCES